MEDKKLLNNEELEKVAGGVLPPLVEDEVFAHCECGGEITLNCDVRTNKDGKMELKCPLCGEWFLVEK